MKALIILLLLTNLSVCNSQTKQIDESILKEKSKLLLTQFNSQSEILSAASDTFLDLNFDGIDDYIINYYGSAGSGIKNKVSVYLYDPTKNDYVLNDQLSDLSNPTFFIAEEKITEFYIGNGGGGGSELHWKNNKWITTKSFAVENNENKSLWIITNESTGEIEKVTLPFQLVPPKIILETNVRQ